MFRLPDAARRFLLGLTLAAVVLTVIAAAGAQTRGTNANARPRPTPVTVPRLPQRATPTPTPAIINVPTSQDDAPPPPPPPTPTPKPRPTPTPKPVDEAIDESEVVRVTSNLVVVPVAVTDAGGNAVQGLKREDFQLEEEGRAQELQAVGTADEVPLDIAVLFDVSSSSVRERFDFEKRAAANFLKSVLKPGDRAAVFAIEDKPRLVQKLAAADVAAGSLLNIPPPPERRLRPSSTPCVGRELPRQERAGPSPPRHRRAHGRRRHGAHRGQPRSWTAEARSSSTSFASRSRRSCARCSAPTPSSTRSTRAATRCTSTSAPRARRRGWSCSPSSTGGSAFVPEFEDRLDAIFRQVAAELRAQYLLQYLSNNQAAAGKFLRIKVSTPARPETRIRARQGYFKKG